MNRKDNRIIIYTDGACKGNPGPGGYGIIMTLENNPYRKEFSKGFRLTTNNRMELLAIIDALKKVKRKNADIVIVTDSKYVSDAINKGWLEKWKMRAFKRIKNPDLWKELDRLLQQHQVQFVWLKGHNGHPENEKCDRLAVKAASAPANKLNIDKGYEQPPDTPPSLF